MPSGPDNRKSPHVLPRTAPGRLLLAGILSTYLVLAALYSVKVPIFEASDELWHYPMVEVLARTWTLPVQPTEPGTTSGPWRQEGSQQPLYYALGALLTSWIDTGDMEEVRQINPHARAGEITPERDNVNLVIHHPSGEQLPWTGTVLAVHIVRFVSVLLGTWAVALTWLLVHELYPDRDWVPLTATAVQAFTPMFLFIGSSINNDNLIVPLCTLALLLMIRRIRATEAFSRRGLYGRDLWLGIVLGLALLTKTSALGLLPFVGATVAWEMIRLPVESRWTRRAAYLVTHLVTILVPALVISGWWYARNLRLYGDLLGWSAFEAVLGTRDVAASLGQLWAERFAFAAGYWGNFGGLNVPMPDVVYRVLNGIAVIAAAGLLFGLGRWVLGKSHLRSAQDRGDISSRLWPPAWSSLTAARALAWAWPVAIFVSWIRWATTTWSSQGRLIFPAIPMWSLALVVGLSAWIPRKQAAVKPLPAVGVGILLLALTIIALPAWIVPAYQPPQALAADASRSDYIPLGAAFGDTLELLGYRIDTSEAQPDGYLDVELLWRAKAPTATYHSIFIHALGKGDRIVAQRDTFPGHGLLPTPQLDSGRVWAEQHLLKIPRTAFTPDQLTMALGVYETATGIRVPLAPVQEAGEDGESYTVEFGEVRLVSLGADADLGIRFGDSIILEGYGLNRLVVQRGENVDVSLDWRCEGPVEYDYTVSVQIIDSHWNKAAQSDMWPAAGARPTSSWSPGDNIAEVRKLTISPDAVPGAYDLRLTLYRPAADGTLEHLPISLSRAGMPVTTIVLTTIRINE